ncbi:MAG: Smr/MutS family protein [Acidobacteriia bacterium]|nr:Smr/MutS family protein [Terriglobia bacterium]
MAEKRKRESGTASGHRPFTELADLIQKAGIGLRTEETALSKPPAAPSTDPKTETAPEDADQVFERAMEGVARIAWRRDPAPTTSVPPTITTDSEAEDMHLFQEAVDSDAPPPLLDHPEYIEGWVGIAGRRFLPNLRNGAYSIQGYIDLHGLSRIEAREAVEAFIIRMSRERSCCVKIVHGRGINSSSDKAVLKEHLQRWLATRRMSHHVVAYASAPHADGGVGAIYVLLRRKQ